MKEQVDDTSIEHWVAWLLRAGVILSGSVMAGGGIYYLVRQGEQSADYHRFRSEPANVRIVPQIIHSALAGEPTGIIQTGVLLLIATPIARVVLSLAGFAMERDRKYMLITAIVLCVLLYSLISGAAAG